MILQEIEVKLSELNAEIERLLKEREEVLKEWNIAFDSIKPENITCIDENIGDSHKLYLVSGESKMLMCYLDGYDMRSSLEAYYRRIDTSMTMQRLANGGNFEIPEYQKNLIYAKAIEIRDSAVSHLT